MYIFRSETFGAVNAFTHDQSGSNLPTDRGPWFMEAHDVHGALVSDPLILAAVENDGFFLFTDDISIVERERTAILAGSTDIQGSKKAAIVAASLYKELNLLEGDVANRVVALKMLTMHLIRSIDPRLGGIQVYVHHLLQFAESILHQDKTRH